MVGVAGIVVLAEAEAVVAVQPADLGMWAGIRLANIDHVTHLRSFRAVELPYQHKLAFIWKYSSVTKPLAKTLEVWTALLVTEVKAKLLSIAVDRQFGVGEMLRMDMAASGRSVRHIR